MSTSKSLRVALLQERDHGSVSANLDAIETGLREAAGGGAQLVLLQELHNGPYFCQHESVDEFERAEHAAHRRAGGGTRARRRRLAVRAPRCRPVPQHRRGVRSHEGNLRQVPQDAHSG
jgi:predicted amidohydrolase